VKPVYKIRDKTTGLFSTGGTVPGWHARGKSWSGLGPLKVHLSQYLSVNSFRNAVIPDNWEIVVFVLAEGATMPAKDHEAALLEARRKKEERYQRAKSRRCGACGH
jgi:hypothetical protein